MPGLEWVWNEPELQSDWNLARRAPRKFIVPDQKTAEMVVLPDAFSVVAEAFEYDHRNVAQDQVGCSVSCVEMLRGLGLATQDLLLDAPSEQEPSEASWNSHGLAVVWVRTARFSENCGVVHEPVPDDRSHCLIRVSGQTRAERREQWLPLRSRLAKAARVLPTTVAAAQFDKDLAAETRGPAHSER